MTTQQSVPWVGRMGETQWVLVDCVAAIGLLFVSVDGAVTRPANFGAPSWLVTLAAVLVAVPLAVRRYRPVPVFFVVLAANAVLALLAVAGNPAVMVGLAIYSAAAAVPPRRSVLLLVVALVLTVPAEVVAIVAASLPADSTAVLNTIAGSVLILAAGWALGAAMYVQAQFAVRGAEQATRRAVGEERLRIARELHDVITHSLSVITVKASVANYLIEARPEEVRSALAVIEGTGRDTLVELRRMLGVLRADGDQGELEPARRIADLAELAGRVRDAGVRVELAVVGERELPEGVALSVYRIVQEALTNVVKHAAPTRCRVLVDLSGSAAVIDVTDDGRGTVAVAGRDGHGIIGMRERVHLFGGSFEAGPVPYGGFRVTASLPLIGM